MSHSDDDKHTKNSSTKRGGAVEPMAKPIEKDDAQYWIDQLKHIADHQDQSAFKLVFEHYSPLIKAFAIKAGGGGNTQLFAEELVQEVMIKIWRNAGSFNPSLARPSTWIFTIARNTRVDLIRKHIAKDGPLTSEDIFEDITDQGPVDELQQRRNESTLHDSIRALPEDQKQVLGKVYLEGLTHQEVSAHLSLPLGTVKSRLRLALKKLHVLIDR